MICRILTLISPCPGRQAHPQRLTVFALSWGRHQLAHSPLSIEHQTPLQIMTSSASITTGLLMIMMILVMMMMIMPKIRLKTTIRSPPKPPNRLPRIHQNRNIVLSWNKTTRSLRTGGWQNCHKVSKEIQIQMTSLVTFTPSCASFATRRWNYPHSQKDLQKPAKALTRKWLAKPPRYSEDGLLYMYLTVRF